MSTAASIVSRRVVELFWDLLSALTARAMGHRWAAGRPGAENTSLGHTLNRKSPKRPGGGSAAYVVPRRADS
jgi:hypothetical protein